MVPGDTNTTKIARIVDMRRRHQTRKPDGYVSVERQPPMTPIERWQWGALEECQAMQVDQRIGDLLIFSVDLMYSIEVPHPVCSSVVSEIALWSEGSARDHLPSTTFTPSQTAPTSPVAITVTTALKV